MKRNILAGTAVLIICILLIIYFTQNTSLQFSLQDIVSKSWVYDATITLQKRVIRGFKETGFTFYNLKPGKYNMEISAPFYESKTVPVVIHKGKNKIKQVITLAGREIIGIESVYVKENLVNKTNINLELRFAASNREAVENHPCLDILWFCRITEQLKSSLVEEENNVYARFKGASVFKGLLKWSWDTNPVRTYRYYARLPVSDMHVEPGEVYIAEYLILIPKPGQDIHDQLDKIASLFNTIDKIEDIPQEYIAFLKTKLDYYFIANTNVSYQEGIL